MKVVAGCIAMEIVTRLILPSDAAQWEAMRRLLWPAMKVTTPRSPHSSQENRAERIIIDPAFHESH
jgi:hypothetical protein